MIITEFYTTREDGVNLYRTYSDAGLYIRQETGAEYAEAVDVEGSEYIYTETDRPIEDDLTDSEALSIIMGRDSDEPADGD
jgi:hypothetical protein